MALFDIIIPQLMNCRQNCNQTFNNLMDQDWNHWKLQVESWMQDAKETAEQSGAAQPATSDSSNTSGGSQSCGSSANQTNGCSDANIDERQEADNPLNTLFQIWSQFGRSGQQRQSCKRRESNNKVQNDSRRYVIKMDVQHFEPNEISVKIVDTDIVVSGEHPERTDRLGPISRKFQRRFELPADVEPNTIVSTLTPTGVLIIEGLKKRTPNQSGNEINIPVIREETNSSSNDQNSYENDQQMD